MDAYAEIARTTPADTAQRLASQRVDAAGSVGVRFAGGRTRLATLRQEGAAKIRLPRTGRDPVEAVLINTAGGLTGGDHLRWRAAVGTGASLIVTTQACEKIYRSASRKATVEIRIDVAERGRLAWLPQESILFEDSAIDRLIDADLAAGAQALFVESAIFGRRAMGEAPGRARFSDRWRIRHRGRLIHAEDLKLGPDAAGQLARPAIAGGATAFATVLLIGEDVASRLEAARTILGDAGGASAWEMGGTGKLLARLVAGDGYDLRRRLIPLLALLNDEAGLPRVWSL